MLVKEIVRPGQIWPTVREIKDNILRNREHQRGPDQPVFAGPRYMEKLAYARWLENVIRPRWPVGTLCTIARVEEQDNKIPVPLFRVTQLQEIHTFAPIAEYTNEPRCIEVEAQGFRKTATTWYPPGLLRKLTVREIELVHLRDRKPSNNDDQGSPPAANEAYAG